MKQLKTMAIVMLSVMTIVNYASGAQSHKIEHTKASAKKPHHTHKALKTFAVPDVNNPNNLMRAHVGQSGFTSVDPYSGLLAYHIPLINVPENDGLNLYFALEGVIPNAETYGSNVIMDKNFFYPFYGVPNFFYPNNQRLFVDQFGNYHEFKASSNNGVYYSIDHWKEKRESDHWDIFAPNGTHYVLKPYYPPGVSVPWGWGVTEIISPNELTILKYQYINNGTDLASITDGNNNIIKLYYGHFCTSSNGSYGDDCQDGHFLTKITFNGRSAWILNSKLAIGTTPGTDGTEAIELPTKLIYPDNSIVQFNFDGGANKEFGYGGYSALHSITYPDGGISSFKYNGSRVISQTNSGPGITPATWNYSYTYPSGKTVTTITGPNAKRTMTFNGVYPSSNDWNTGLLNSESLYSADGKKLYQTLTKTWKQFTLPNSTIKAPEMTVQEIDRGGNCKTQNCMKYITSFSQFDDWGYPHQETETSKKHTV